MKDKVELAYAGYGWIMTIKNDLVGEYSVDLPDGLAMSVALAISTARQAGVQEGYDKAKKRYKAINDAAGSMPDVFNKPMKPWEDADIPMHWNPKWKLNDPGN